MTNPDPTHSFMTIDAFDVAVSDGNGDTATVRKDHSGPLPTAGRSQADHARAMARERAWLRSAAGVTGVVTLVEDDSCVATEYAGSATLRSNCPPPALAAAILSQVAETIGQLADKGMTHGAVTPEHIVVATDGTATLCSPSTLGAVADLEALGQCVAFATEQWDSPPPNLPQWLLLAKRLEDGDPAMSPHRASLMLDELALPDAAILPGRRRSRRVLVGGVVLVLVAIGLISVARLPGDGEGPVTGPEIEVQGVVVRVGSHGQLAVGLGDDACDQPSIYLLDPETSWVWIFRELNDGSVGTPIVQVPGATSLAVDHRDGCTRALAVGPAGAVELAG